MNRKQTAGFPIEYSISGKNNDHTTLIYSGVAIGIALGAAASAYWWKSRTRALELLQETPFNRVEDLISSCENKIEDIERAIEDLKKAKN